ncbi:MAG TPA: ATP-binding cassette domain-containing protein [Syntrophomonadaceae bacterium]|nr:ATP-binding cassette domain-containing protein [Syntrophomonadaceae bacterium]HPR92873.1 ATP-binding cassette domain-containing protein [Syntrophomonadaceae bacterium]
MNMIDIQDLSYYYPGQAHPALKSIGLQIEKGKICGITGRSGCGKSTLLRAISRLIPDFYGGTLAGEIFFRQRPLKDWSNKDLYRYMGVLSQDAEHSIIFNELKRDVAFGLENLGLSNAEMSRRVGEVLEYFSLNQLSHKSVHHLSGGERQKTALAGIVVMQPEMLVLDEPTAQLDNSTARDFFKLLRKLNQELGITIVIAEQKLGFLFDLADKVAVMENGEIIFAGTPAEQNNWALRHDYPLTPDSRGDHWTMSANYGLSSNKTGLNTGWPVTAAEKSWPDHAVAVRAINFNYGKSKVLENINLELYRGQITALTGDNGAGKTTLIKIILGLIKAGSGQVEVLGHEGKQLQPAIIGREAAYLPQSLDHYFMADTALAEVRLGLEQDGGSGETARDWLEKLNVIKYLDTDPRCLSAGEKQRVAIASITAADPQLILLDEPTRGLDIIQKRVLGQILAGLARQGKAVVVAAHDGDFVSAYADRVIFMQQGRIITDETRDLKNREAL